MTTRILQFGTTGQLARELLGQAKDFDVEITSLSRAEAAFSDPGACAAKVTEHRPDLVVIAAAYTAVDQAEAERDLAQRINAAAPAAIAAAAAATGAAVVYISTDYVFDGAKGAPYLEMDAVNPVNAYGQTKLDGERNVLERSPRSLVVRTSWVVSSHGRNFVKTMLRLAGEGKPIRVVDDQYGRPTAARDLARFVLAQAARLAAARIGDPVFGVVNFANDGEVSWKAFAEGVFDLALGAEAPAVAGIPTAEYPTPARRPLRGTLDTAKLAAVFGVTPRPWREALAEIVTELKMEQRSAA
jgi:dTDP-4-dehydrorhamnose reductase